MAFELAAYGFVTGMLHKFLPKKKGFIYVSLLIAMVAGRMVWGLAMFACMGFDATKFGIPAFVAGAFTTAIRGIIVQIVLIPVLVIVAEKYLNKHN